MTGAWPKDQIDHVNGDRSDNRFCNLREATNSQNQANRRCEATSTSGVKGVSWDRRCRRWQAQISINGKPKHLGGFTSKEEAARAYAAAAIALRGEFARLV